MTSSLLGENALFKSIGQIFHPLFELFGLILAGIYAVIPNCGAAIIGLTIIIMAALTPVTPRPRISAPVTIRSYLRYPPTRRWDVGCPSSCAPKEST